MIEQNNSAVDSDTIEFHKTPQKKSRKNIQAAMFSGPIPPPNILAQYEQLKAGLAERIVIMAESQSQHRKEMEIQSLNAQ